MEIVAHVATFQDQNNRGQKYPQMVKKSLNKHAYGFDVMIAPDVAPSNQAVWTNCGKLILGILRWNRL
jgi:hypothetical protein